MKYTFSDGEEDSDSSMRQSTRNATPLDSGPTITASGRQVKPRVGGSYGESMHYDQRRELEQTLGDSGVEDSDDMPTTLPSGRSQRVSAMGAGTRPRRPPAARTREVYNGDDDMDTDESDEAQSSGKEWSGDENDADDADDDSEPDFDGDEEEDVSGDELDDDEPEEPESLVVKLSYRKPKPFSILDSPEVAKTNGLPVLSPKPPAQLGAVPEPIIGFSQSTPKTSEEDKIWMDSASSPYEPGSDSHWGSRVSGQQSQQEDAVAETKEQEAELRVNGYGMHGGALPIGGVLAPQAQPQVKMQMMDVS
jgi:hypothetical protein